MSFLGIIQAAPRRGLTLGVVDINRVSEYLGFHLAINTYPHAELLQTRIIIETGALGHLAAVLVEHPERYDELVSVANLLPGARGPQARVTADVAFHRALIQASGVRPLAVFNEFLQIFFERLFDRFDEDDWKGAARQHREVLDSLRAGNLDGARQCLKEHLEFHAAGV